MTAKANNEIRKAAKSARVPFWRLAEYMEISETAMSRKLRHELSDSEREEMLAAIEELKEAH